jgi:hypothetical protein
MYKPDLVLGIVGIKCQNKLLSQISPSMTTGEVSAVLGIICVNNPL